MTTTRLCTEHTRLARILWSYGSMDTFDIKERLNVAEASVYNSLFPSRDLNPVTRELPETKVCYKCRNEFARTAEHFQRDKGQKDGLSRACKGCRAIDRNARYRRHVRRKRVYA